MTRGQLTIRLGSLIVIAMLLVTTIGCGPGYHISNVNGEKKVYYTDEQGKKRLVYEVDKSGNTTVYDESDPMYQKHVAKQQMAERMKQAEADRNERIGSAPKRSDNDPIYVALHRTELGTRLKQAEHRHGAVYEQIRKEFESDRVIKLVSKKDLERDQLAQLGKALRGLNPKQGPVADVDVVSRAYLKEVYGINRRTGKPGKMAAVVFEATITSNYLPSEYKVTESGTVFRNVEVSKRFADKIKRIIKKKIGPSIPADRAAY